jgi:hypothetical protein
VVEQVRGWHVEIRLRIPLDDPSDGNPMPRPKRPKPRTSTVMCLRSVGVDELATDRQPCCRCQPSRHRLSVLTPSKGRETCPSHFA